METKSKLAGWLALLAAGTLLQGCATQLSVANETSAPAVRFQTNAVNAAAVAPRDLQPGDILLSTDPTLMSASIRLMTFSPVSHAALYVGNGRVVEALYAGVTVRSLEEFLDESAMALVMRYPELSDEQARLIVGYAADKAGAGYNFVGLTLQLPFTVSRRVCELPFVSSTLRDACLRSLGVLPTMAAREKRLFCSQLVLQAYRQAGVEITSADPRRVSPADILHMREGDVPSVKPSTHLRYVGNLKMYKPTFTALALQQ